MIYQLGHMGVSQNRGTPKWMVYNGKPFNKMDDLRVPYFWRKHPYDVQDVQAVSSS